MRKRRKRRTVSKGRRDEFASFGWQPESVPDPQEMQTFERSKLDWSELAEPTHRRVLEWHRSLIQLRRRYPELVDGRLDRVAVELDVVHEQSSYTLSRPLDHRRQM